MPTVILLIISNAFMTIAWYGHLKFENKPLWMVILASWGIAFFEYCFQVPANRWGAMHSFSPAQLKITTEVIGLLTFFIFAKFYLNETFTWNYFVSFGLIVAAVVFAFAFK